MIPSGTHLHVDALTRSSTPFSNASVVGAQVSSRATENLAIALALADAGMFVLPAEVIRKRDRWVKKPIIKRWQAHATADEHQIRQWWRDHPHAVPGIELGRSGLVIIDADRHGGPDGVVAFRELASSKGELPQHPITQSPGDGEHHISPSAATSPSATREELFRPASTCAALAVGS